MVSFLERCQILTFEKGLKLDRGAKMKNIDFREVRIDECGKMKDIDPQHYIKNAWRLVDGKRQLVEIDYHEKSWPDGFERYYNELIEIIKADGVAFGAFDSEEKLLGIATLKKQHFGKSAKYVLLDSMFVTYEKRGLGLGKALFNLCVEKSRDWNVDKIYICAGSAEDTIAFYKGIGCVDALEINEKLYTDDPRDMQLEYIV